MLKPYNITDYYKEYHPRWTCEMPSGCPPENILVPFQHPFYRLTRQADQYDGEDFESYAENDPLRNWGEKPPFAIGLSLIDNEQKAIKNLKLPMFRNFKGIVSLLLNPTDGVVKQTGAHRSHFTWWRTTTFNLSNLKMLQR